LLTIPITIITLGLFLLVINIIIIYLAAYLVPGFEVSNWLAALIFSLVLAVLSFLLDAIF
jgi:putative membrane protein